MRKIAASGAVIALAALIGGRAYAHDPQVEVPPAPIHAVPDAGDEGPAPPPALASATTLQQQAEALGLTPGPRPATARLVTAEMDADAPALRPAVLQTPVRPAAQAAAQAAAEDQEADDQEPAEAQGAGPAAAPVAASPAAPRGPTVSLSHQVIDAAGAFDAYIRAASAIDPKFADGDSVAHAVLTGGAYEPGQLQQGAVAYAALVALQDPLFVQVVGDMAQNPVVRQAFVEQLLHDPSVVLQAPAARAEATRVAVVLSHLGGRLLSSGQAVKQAAYDVQHQAWSKAPIAAPEARLAKVKLESGQPFALAAGDTPQLISAVTAWRQGDVAPGGAYAATPVVTQGLALAALAVLGEAGEEKADRISPLLAEAASAQCMKMAKLNLYQCLSVAGPHYEDVFCLGRHAMMETAQCVVSAAGVPAEMLMTPTPPAAVPAAMQVAARPSILVPVAADPDEGSERASAFAQGPGGGPAPTLAYATSGQR